MTIKRFICIICIIYIILIILIILRYVSNLVSQITSVWTSTKPLPRLLIHWVLSSSLQCALAGWDTSERPIQMELMMYGTALARNSWCLMVMNESLLHMVMFTH
jgi:hypothetical protein